MFFISGCTIKNNTEKKVTCKGTIRIETLSRDFSVALTSRREGNAGVFYYTNDPAFRNSWVNEDVFKRIKCE